MSERRVRLYNSDEEYAGGKVYLKCSCGQGSPETWNFDSPAVAAAAADMHEMLGKDHVTKVHNMPPPVKEVREGEHVKLKPGENIFRILPKKKGKPTQTFKIEVPVRTMMDHRFSAGSIGMEIGGTEVAIPGGSVMACFGGGVVVQFDGFTFGLNLRDIGEAVEQITREYRAERK